MQKIDAIFKAIIETVLVIVLLTMVVLCASQVFLRDVFSGGISWSDAAARNMVIWVMFLGAVLATRKRQHIAIDAISRFIPKSARNFVLLLTDIFSCVVAFLLARASYLFVMGERAVGDMAFAQVPFWVVEIIIPIGFILISLEYAIGVVLGIRRIAGRA